MVRVARGKNVLNDLCDAMGLGPNVRRLRIDVSMDDIVIVEVEMLAEDEPMQEAVNVLKRYRLEEIDEPTH